MRSRDLEDLTLVPAAALFPRLAIKMPGGLYSSRFQRPIVITRHAAQRMTERGISRELLLAIVDTGSTRYSDARHLWAWLEAAGRTDNLLCVVLVLEDSVVVKTLMHHWELMP